MIPRVLIEVLNPLPPDALVPVGWVRSHLQSGESSHSHESLEDLDVEAAAALVKRAPSTVRGWLAAGFIPEAYRLRGRHWRIPRAAFRRFLDRQGSEPVSKPAHGRRGGDLGEWRKHIKEAG